MATSEEDKNDETTLLMMLCGGGLPVVVALLGTLFDRVRTFLLEKGIVVLPEQALWVLPGLDAGLDLLRIVIVAAAFLLLVVAPGLAIRKRRSEAR